MTLFRTARLASARRRGTFALTARKLALSTSHFKTVKRTLLLFFAILLVLFTVKSVFALSILTVTAPATATEGASLAVSFTTDEPAAYRILKDGAQVSSSNSYVETLGYDSAGLHEFMFEAVSGTTVTTTRTVEVLDTPLALTRVEPSQSDYATARIPIDVRTNIPVDVCYTVTEQGTRALALLNATRAAGNVTLNDGVQTMTIKCSRSSEIAQVETTLKVDTTPPSVALAPTGIVTSGPVALTATTDEAAVCRYATAPLPYDAMTSQLGGTTPTLTHAALVNLKDGVYTYHVACRDALANEASASTTFTVKLLPSGSLQVEGKNPRKAGTYKVELEVSEPLATMPTLTLGYQGGSSLTLALTQEGTTRYEGYVIVEEGAGEKVGTFTFSGTDGDGGTGTKLEGDTLFRVDTVKPVKVEVFNAVNGSGSANLAWYYDGTDEVTFNVYRKLVPGVEYTDYYVSTIGDEYRDYDVMSSVYYHYRIAAVDEAGNIGPLSGEEWASAAIAQYDAEGAGAFLEPVLQVDLDRRVASLALALMDAKRTVLLLRQESDARRAKLIKTLGLLKDAEQSLAALERIKGGLEALRSIAITAPEYETRVTQLSRDESEALGKLATTLTVLDNVEYDETPTKDQVDAAVNTVLRGNPLSDVERKSYRDATTALQSGVQVSTSVTQLRIVYADSRQREVTLVEKRLLSQELLRDVLAVETVPKTVAKSASELSHFTTAPIVLEDDPILQYSFETLVDEEIAYGIERLVGLTMVRGASLVLLPKPPMGTAAVPVEGNAPVDASSTSGKESLTGFVTSAVGALGSGQVLIILIGILIAAGLLAYYVRLQTESDEGGVSPQVASPQDVSLQGAQAREAGVAYAVVAGGASWMPDGAGRESVMRQSASSSAATVLVTRKEEPFTGLLVRGHSLIDQNKYLDALYFYKAALARFDTEEFASGRIREAVREELELLHAKLQLFDAGVRAHDAVVGADTRALAATLEEMRSWAEAVGESGTPLVEKSAAEYTYLYLSLNRLRSGAHDEPEE